ncbi:tetraacyldisaccharide 4'-kinase [Prevotella sp. E13-17]|uniref:tetraacyldisaccharide 4'-kinase n=1 Tax=Prevotella sp. E13-17 TaxID=2913616 RepID=UPI00351D84EF
MEGDFIKINKWLLPLGWLYGCVVQMRNYLFEMGILKSESFSTPVISVGNITVGGTGKTPHIEYLIRLLEKSAKVAVLSRGYKRTSKGFLIADEHSTAQDIGDEPYQMKQKFPDITIAVEKKRAKGIKLLLQKDPKLDVILLDDAFQHRYVKPGINILLVDYHRLIIYDKMLPAGRMREPLSGKNRADIIIVTKCPKSLTPMEYRVITKAMDLFPYQELYFSTLSYGKLTPLFKEAANAQLAQKAGNLTDLKDQNCLLLTGIASPQQMIEDLKPHAASLHPLTFPDHHSFNPQDIERINAEFNNLQGPKCIVTTEKDAARIKHTQGLSEAVKSSLFVLPLEIEFMLEQTDKFNQKIINYVRKNSRNSILVKRKDDHKPKNSHHSGDRPRTISFRNN